MTSKLCILCNKCLTIALNSPCECGSCASRYVGNKLVVYSDTVDDIVLSKVWINDESGLVAYYKRYKDLGLAKIVPFTYNKESK